MGLITKIGAVLFGNQRNVVRDTIEVFRENSEGRAQREHDVRRDAIQQFASEFNRADQGGFGRFMDGLNRVPRPAMALGVIALFVCAMAAPEWFAVRMEGLVLVPDPLWWLLGVIVSFYFGARYQVKSQEFQKSVAQNVEQMRAIRSHAQQITPQRAIGPLTPQAAASGTDAQVELATTTGAAGNNPAIRDWKRTQGKNE